MTQAEAVMKEEGTQYLSTPCIYEKQISIEKQIEDMSYHELEAVITRARVIKHLKYPSSKKPPPVCPNLRKGFSEEHLVTFFKTLSVKDRMGRTLRGKNTKKLLLRQFFYALRVGEVCRATLNPYTRLVRVETSKQGRKRIDYIPFIEGTESLFDCSNVSPDCLRNTFRKHLYRLGGAYPDVYHKDTKGHYLHRLTTHSLRITASNLLRKHTRDPYKQKVFLRHCISRAYGATSHYMEYHEDDYRRDLNDVFRPYVEALLLSESNE